MSETPPPVDLTVLPELTGCEIEMLGEFLQDFRQIGQETAEQLQEALALGDGERLKQVAHRVKSSARYIGALRLGDWSEQLEHGAQAGQLAQAPALLQQWLAEWRLVDQFLQTHLAAHPA